MKKMRFFVLSLLLVACFAVGNMAMAATTTENVSVSQSVFVNIRVQDLYTGDSETERMYAGSWLISGIATYADKVPVSVGATSAKFYPYSKVSAGGDTTTTATETTSKFKNSAGKTVVTLYYSCPSYVFHASYASKKDTSTNKANYSFGPTDTTKSDVNISRSITCTEKD